MRSVSKTRLIVAICVALWPVLIFAQPPEPKGKLVFSDDFSSGQQRSFEDQLAAQDFSRGFHAPGVYQLALRQTKDTRWVVLPNHSYATFTVEADVWDNSDTLTGDASQGLVFRVQDDTHLYAVLLNERKGQYAARKLNGKDQWSDLVPWTASPLIKQQSEVNHLRVDGEGNHFVIYVNDEQLGSFSDGAYTSGNLGMIIDSVDAVGAHMHFDNLKIYSPEVPSAAASEMLPVSGSTRNLGIVVLSAVAPLLVVFGYVLRRRGAPRKWVY